MNQPVQTIATTLKPGDTVGRGRYVVQKFLGSGTMARVYHAFDIQISSQTGTQDRALKILDPQETALRHNISEQEVINDFDREARILLHSTHRHVVRAYDHFVENGLHVLVLEYVDGVTLEEAKKLRTLSEEDVYAWTFEALDMLEDLHAKQLVYRDLKPGNMMVRANNRLTFIDFGTARDVGIPLAQGAQASGTAVGTPGYAAPEQWSGKLDTRSDLYALGVIMKELLSGSDPVVFDTQPLTGHRLELCSFVNKATRLDVNERYQSVVEMRQCLEGTRGIVSRVLAGITTPQPIQRRHSLEEIWNEIMRVKTRLDSTKDWTMLKGFWINAIELERRGCVNEAIGMLHKWLGLGAESSSGHFADGMIYEWMGKFRKAVRCYRKAIQVNAQSSEAYDGIARIEAKVEQERQERFAQKLVRKTARNAKVKQVGAVVMRGVSWLGRQLDPRNLSVLIDGGRMWMPHIAVLIGTILGFTFNKRVVGYDFPVLIGIILGIALLLGCIVMFQFGIHSFGGSRYSAFGDGCMCMFFSLLCIVLSVFLFSLNTGATYICAQWGPRSSVLIGYEESYKAMRVDIKEDSISEKEWIYVKEDGEPWLGENPADTEGAVMVSARNAAEARGKVAKISGKDTILRVFFERHRKDIRGKNHKIWRVALKTI